MEQDLVPPAADVVPPAVNVVPPAIDVVPPAAKSVSMYVTLFRIACMETTFLPFGWQFNNLTS